MVALAPPLLVTVSDRDLLLLSSTLPKSRLDCVGLRVPGLTETPLPESATVTELFDASLEIVRFPLTLPAAPGVKVMLTDTFCPIAKVTGRAGCVMENWLVLETALLTLTAAIPVFVAMAVSVLLFPTVTLPKLMVDPLRLRAPLGVVCCFAPALIP